MAEDDVDKELHNLVLARVRSQTEVHDSERGLLELTLKKQLDDLMQGKTLSNLHTEYSDSERTIHQNADLHGVITDIVKKQIQSKIYHRGYLFQGNFVEVGSYRDGTRPGDLNEMDYLFMNEFINLELIETNRGGEFRIRDKTTGVEIFAGDIQIMFANAIESVMEDGVELPLGLKHAGYASPHFSGVRRNGPASTLLFYHNDELVSIDMTPAFYLPHEIEIQLAKFIDPKLEPVRRDNLKTNFSFYGKIHLVPKAPQDKTWQLTTSELEAEILHAIPQESSIKRVIQLGKLLNRFLKDSIHKQIDDESLENPQAVNEVLLIMSQYKKDINGTLHQNELRRIINKRMRYLHIFIPWHKEAHFGELTKPVIGLNSTALKYMAFVEGRDIKGFFGSANEKEISEDRLLRIFSDIATNTPVPHYFLQGEVDTLSLAAYAYNYDLDRIKTTALALCKEMTLKLTIQTPLHWPSAPTDLNFNTLLKKHEQLMINSEGVFICSRCYNVIFNLHDIYIVGNKHRAVISEVLMNNMTRTPVEHRKPPFDGLEKTDDINCSRCNTDWGIMVKIRNTGESIPIIKPVGFVFHFSKYFHRRVKQWKSVPLFGHRIKDFQSLV